MARQRNNNINNTAPEVNTTQNKPSFRDRFNNNSSTLIAMVTIFGFGYGTAFVISSLNHRMEIIELNAIHKQELSKQKEELNLQKESNNLNPEEVKLFLDNYNKNNNEKK